MQMHIKITNTSQRGTAGNIYSKITQANVLPSEKETINKHGFIQQQSQDVCCPVVLF